MDNSDYLEYGSVIILCTILKENKVKDHKSDYWVINMILISKLTCPHCGYGQLEELQENVSPINYRCGGCSEKVIIHSSECCIYCQYGDMKCLHAQIIGSSCCNG